VTTSSPDLADLLPSWLVKLRAERKSDKTVKLYRDGVRQFLAWCTTTGTPAELTRANVQAFMAALLDAGAHGLRSTPPSCAAGFTTSLVMPTLIKRQRRASRDCRGVRLSTRSPTSWSRWPRSVTCPQSSMWRLRALLPKALRRRGEGLYRRAVVGSDDSIEFQVGSVAEWCTDNGLED
jgi:hypothetical protein